MISKMTPLSTAGFYSHRKTHLPQKSNKEESEVNPVAHLGLNERKRKIWEEKLKRIEDMVQLLQDKPLPVERKSRVSDPMYIYRLFPKQQQAFDFSESCGQDVMVFSKELNTYSDGRRNYLVTTSREFWEMYKSLVSEERCYYEVIPEGSPCRLYFDLEFKKEMNPQHDGENMVEIFIKCVCQELMRQYKIYCNKRNVVHLDSSTENKFSAHLIFHLPNAVFKDNIHAGRFVEHVCAKIFHENLVSCKNDLNNCEMSPLKSHENYLTTRDNTSPETANNIETEILGKGELQELMIKNSKGDEDIFCDRGVYTKNRNFRLYLSTKIGRNSPLVLSKKNIFQPNIGNKKLVYSLNEHLNFSLFLDSLVSNVRLDADMRILTFDVTSENVSNKPRKKVAATPVEMGQESPYPEVDELIKDSICKGGVQGYIRRCLYFKERGMISYDIGNNRWCENIGRPHKSNHIMMVADLINCVYYQKCHDPECKKIDFRSPELPLPFDINLASNVCVDTSLEYFDENIDEEILTAIEQLEEQARATQHRSDNKDRGKFA